MSDLKNDISIMHKVGNWFFRNAYLLYKPFYIIYKKVSDRHERRLLKKIIKPGMNVVDVGANIGIYTCFLSKLVGNSGHVYSFEPDCHNYNLLIKNVRGLKNVTVVHGAVGNETGDMNLFLSDDLNVDHRTFDAGDNRKTETVKSFRLDDYFHNNPNIDFIKMDIQGFEFFALQGMREILEKNTDITLVMEFWPYGLKKSGVNPEELVQHLIALGFNIEIIDPQKRDFFLPHFNKNSITDDCYIFLTR